MKKYGCVIDIPKRRLWLQNVAVPLESLVIAKQEKEFCQAVVTLTEKVIVAPWSELEVLGSTGAMCTTRTWLVEGKNKSDLPVMVARGVVNSIQDDELWCVPIRLCNPSSAETTVYWNGSSCGGEN